MEPTILAVDDDPAVTRLACALLKREGFRTLEAASGAQTLELLKTHNPDLILLDIIMPDMDGFEVCKAIRQNPRTADIRIVMLSSVSEQVRDSTTRVDGYVAKPFRPADLVAKVKEFLAQ